ncbi:hypothetical protein INR49_024419, partial [Caranx melampygus]
MSAHCKVLVEVVDLNDNAPEITVTSLVNTVREDAEAGTAVALVSILDKDSGKNGAVRAEIANDAPFKLDTNYKNYYSLVVNGPLDRETKAQYNVTIVATDEGTPPLSSTNIVTVDISDVNDNPPRFSEPQVNVYVKENSPVGSVIKKVSAVDADIDQNGQMAYSFLQSEIDYEENQAFEIRAQASDKGQPPMSAHCKVLVEVVDLNDNAPEITVTSLVNTVREDAEAGTAVALVSILDKDSGKNGAVRAEIANDAPFKLDTNYKNYYSLVGSSQSQRMMYLWALLQREIVRQRSGEIDYEENQAFEIHAQASDKGQPPMSAHCKVLVEVVDLNDNAPEITVTSLVNTVREDAEAGTAVALVSVLDKDSGKNGAVRAEIANDAPFKLDTNYKNYYSLVVNGPLDRETKAQYDVTIVATDEGTPPLSSTNIVTVHVSDVNDNPPRFSEPQVNVYVKENSPVGSVIKTVTAVDADIDENG